MRVIPRLDIKTDYLIKSIRYEGLRNLGDPSIFAKKYYEEGATEIMLIDNVASLYRRDSSFEIIKAISNNIFIPLIFCGGLRTIEDVEKAFESGADKVAINTALFESIDLVDEVVKRFGSQSIIGSIEAKKLACGDWECYCYNGRESTGIKVGQWIKILEDKGVGEIFISSVDNDGTQKGTDVELAKSVVENVNIPVIIGSGMGNKKHIQELLETVTPSGISIGSALHYNDLTLKEINEVILDV